MKNIAFIFLFLFANNFLCGQTTFFDSTSNVGTTVYIGILGGPSVSVIGLKTTSLFSARVGGTISWQPKKWFSAFGLLAKSSDELIPINLFVFKLYPYKKLCFTIGKGGSPMTEFRPMPTTGYGQFETWTSAQILGGSLGIKLSYTDKDFSMVYGVFRRDYDLSLESKIKFSDFQIGGYYLKLSNSFGGAVKYSIKNFSMIIVYNHKKSFGTSLVFKIPKINLSLYSDFGTNPIDRSKIMRNEFGIFKNFKFSQINTIYGAGYDLKNKAIKGYLFIYL